MAAVASVPGAASPAASPLVKVDVELVLAVDVSSSVTPEEALLQRDGYVRALLHPLVGEAVGSGPRGRIAVAYFEWADARLEPVVVGWMVLDGPEAAKRFAGKIEAAPHVVGRYTGLGGAIDRGAEMIAGNRFDGLRRVIDVSGDGRSNDGRDAAAARDAAVAAGITINGLPILTLDPDDYDDSLEGLEAYYRREVIGGDGSFVIPVADMDSFGRSVLQKLVREIAEGGPTPGGAIIAPRAASCSGNVVGSSTPFHLLHVLPVLDTGIHAQVRSSRPGLSLGDGRDGARP